MTNNIFFLKEQDGDVERHFKQAVCSILAESSEQIRAYLMQVAYGSSSSDFNVAVCIRTATLNNPILLAKLKTIFSSTFSILEHLDIIFIDEEQENIIRKICCPFFTSKKYQTLQPDFYLSSSEGYGLDTNKPIACFKKKRLYGNHPDGYLVCDIKPMLFGVDYHLEQNEITEIIVACRHKGYTLFPITSWPALVHVAVPRDDRIIKNNTFQLNNGDIVLIAWGDLTKSS